MTRHRRYTVVVLIALIMAAVAVAVGTWSRRQQQDQTRPRTGLTAFRNDVDAARPAGTTDQKRFAVHIRKPDGPPTIELADGRGGVTEMGCATCHSLREPDRANRRPADLQSFHTGMHLAHGQLTCFSCHNPDDYETLRLADQTVVAYVDVMTLCSQCHGPQARDYERGAHGGMTGYWDLSRGPRRRNGCTDCHDPHAPNFPRMIPTFKPRDRFLTPAGSKVEKMHD